MDSCLPGFSHPRGRRTGKIVREAEASALDDHPKSPKPQALRYLIDLVGADHVCIGTDGRSTCPTIIQRPRSMLCLELRRWGALVCLLRNGFETAVRGLNKGRPR